MWFPYLQPSTIRNKRQISLPPPLVELGNMNIERVNKAKLQTVINKNVTIE